MSGSLVFRTRCFHYCGPRFDPCWGTKIPQMCMAGEKKRRKEGTEREKEEGGRKKEKEGVKRRKREKERKEEERKKNEGRKERKGREGREEGSKKLSIRGKCSKWNYWKFVLRVLIFFFFFLLLKNFIYLFLVVLGLYCCSQPFSSWEGWATTL